MTETEVDVYKLNADDRKQSLRISIINNETISMILTNITTEQKFISSVSLPQLRKLCQIFNSIETIKEAIQILKETIEGGNIMITEDPQNNIIELKYTVITENDEYPPFDIDLKLEKENKEEDVQVLPPTFDYQGDKEVEKKYGDTTDNTTEYVNPIVQSNVKPPILQLEYIEPILQVHYPDGTTKSTALPPRIQGVDGKMPDITEEQFKSIQEQMNKNCTIRNFSPLKEVLNENRSNSVAKKTISAYSTQSTPYPASNNINRVNPFGKAVEPNDNLNRNKTENNPAINHVKTVFNDEGQYNYLNNLNNNLNKTSSGYSTMTMQARPFPIPEGINYRSPMPNPSLQNNNLNQTNIFQKSKMVNQAFINPNNNIIERRPRMIDQRQNQPRDANRSQSLPSNDNMHKFNPYKNPDIYQSNQMNNPFQKNNSPVKNNIEKYPYDRNTQRVPNRNNLNILNKNNINNLNNINSVKKIPLNQESRNVNMQQININNQTNNLSHIERQQQRLLEVQKKLAEIQMQQKQLRARQNEIIFQQRQNQQNQIFTNNQLNPNININQQMRLQQIQNQGIPPNQKMQVMQIQSTQNQQNPMIRKANSQSININQNQMQFQRQQQMRQLPQYQNSPPQPKDRMIRQTNSLTNNQQFLQHQNSQEINKAKTRIINPNQQQKVYQNNQNKFRTQISSPIPSQTSSLVNKDISQQLISLAQIASMQNEENPNYKSFQAITLEQQERPEQHVNINIAEQQKEQDEIQEYNPQEEVNAQEQQPQQQNQESSPEVNKESDINVEALFFTEEGRVIFRNGLLRGIIHKYAEIDDVVSKIQDKLLKGVKFNLVYKAFDVGDKAKDFHEICDKLEMSLVLIETDKDIRFGGFTTQSWEGHCVKKKDNNAFVFSLETNKIFDIIPNEPAIGCYPKFGPVFFGCQIRIYDEFFTKGGTTCHKGLNYKTDEDYELNNGEQKYLIKDIEIYSIETIDI